MAVGVVAVVPVFPVAAVPTVIVPVPLVLADVLALLRLAVISTPAVISLVRRLDDTAAEQHAEREQAAQP
jgi:hypothetical protein